ncbi:MAG: aldehyde dehydrogenase family protein, partial [Candidatus Binatia bacterium]|nr:aldehyde dehydrogenase family protein [Candidatus Binatia bacterium]
MDLERMIVQMGQAARAAARALAKTPTPAKNQALLLAAQRLRAASGTLLAVNQLDVEAARQAGLSAAMLDRLTLTEGRIEAMARGLEIIAELPDPVGETIAMWRRPNGLEIAQVRIPLGVVGVIYESRPNVTADAAGLCLKAGNATILKGGSEALRTNTAIVDVLTEAVITAGLPPATIQLVRSPDRQAVAVLLRQEGVLDVI